MRPDTYKYLITGLPGSGKTSVCNEIMRHGFRSIDLDDGYAYWANRQSGESVAYQPEAGHDWLMAHEWKLNQAALQAALDSHIGALYVCGVVNNMYSYMPLFDRTILLEYPTATSLTDRLASRTGSRAFGKQEHEIADGLRTRQSFQSSIRGHGGIAIDCTRSLQEVVDNILIWCPAT